MERWPRRVYEAVSPSLSVWRGTFTSIAPTCLACWLRHLRPHFGPYPTRSEDLLPRWSADSFFGKEACGCDLTSEKILSGARGDFIVAVLNGGTREILFSTSDIIVSMPSTTDTPETSQLKVYSYEELVAEERTRQAWAAISTDGEVHSFRFLQKKSE